MAETYTPQPESDARLRAAFGRFATGVTVVTAPSARGPLGITANSFTSVSLTPPLLLWCPAKASKRHDAFVGAAQFALHVMGRAQDEITAGFARSGHAFDLCDWEEGENGVPLIAGCPARFECAIRDRIDAGDHTVIVARVTRVTLEPSADPRVILGGVWGGFLQD
jgi:flavin reductase (DIM6/NTAB) family NADH-FMN oxidoreductase RutF